MAHYIAYATEAGTTLPHEMKEQAVSMLMLGLWGIPSAAQLKTKLLPGDGLIIAVGSPHREFIGDAVLSSRYRQFSDDEIAALPPGLEFDHGLILTRARLWPEAIPIEKVWARVAAATRNPRAHFRGAINSVSSRDAVLIMAEGTRGTGSHSGLVYAPVAAEREAVAADAEDTRIVSVMNARRAEQGKPPLTPEQEKHVRANRRSERERERPW
jgi:hypothetical protein